jgi:hypothetical protein
LLQPQSQTQQDIQSQSETVVVDQERALAVAPEVQQHLVHLLLPLVVVVEALIVLVAEFSLVLVGVQAVVEPVVTELLVQQQRVEEVHPAATLLPVVLENLAIQNILAVVVAEQPKQEVMV